MSAATTQHKAAQPSQVRNVGEGFWNVRGSMKVDPLKLIDAGSHMSLARVSNGKFLVLSTISLEPEVKEWLDGITNNGQLIDAVIATHPFHTSFFQKFYEAYPQLKYYGTPRHLRTVKNVEWAGSVKDVLSKWEPDVSMRIPDGAEFDDPAPGNHFSSVFVLHRPSRTIHDDDTITFIDEENAALPLRLVGFGPGKMSFHPTLTNIGIKPDKEAPLQFERFMDQLLKDWDFDNICTAHKGNKIGGGKEQLRQLLDDTRPTLKKMSDARKTLLG